jgi:hypothetical protein
MTPADERLAIAACMAFLVAFVGGKVTKWLKRR